MIAAIIPNIIQSALVTPSFQDFIESISASLALKPSSLPCNSLRYSVFLFVFTITPLSGFSRVNFKSEISSFVSACNVICHFFSSKIKNFVIHNRNNFQRESKLVGREEGNLNVKQKRNKCKSKINFTQQLAVSIAKCCF